MDQQGQKKGRVRPGDWPVIAFGMALAVFAYQFVVRRLTSLNMAMSMLVNFIMNRYSEDIKEMWCAFKSWWDTPVTA